MRSARDDPGFDYKKFEGFPDPHWTQVPDLVFDGMLPDLSGAELKVLLYLIRRTYGFKKDGDSITFSQLCHGIRRSDGTVIDRGTGLSKSTVSLAIKTLEEKHLIEVSRDLTAVGDAEVNYYTVRRFVPSPGVVRESDNPTPKPAGGVVRKSNSGGPISVQRVVRKSDPQDTDSKRQYQETQQQQQTSALLAAVDGPKAVVASGSSTPDNNGLSTRLEALGVWPASIPAILEAHDTARVEGWVADIEARMGSGGEFRSGPAAFLVAALRNGWPLPERSATGNGRKAAELARLAEDQETAAAEEAKRERLRMENALGVDDATRELWEIVRGRLHEQGHGHWALASAYLGPLKRGKAIVTTPAEMLLAPLEQRAEAIRGALQEATGKTVKSVEVQVAQT